MSLEAFLNELAWEKLDKQTRQTARLCVLDALGCALAGSRAGAVADLARSISHRNAGQTPVWGTAWGAKLPWAIFLNAHAAAYYDLDDGHRKAQGHPGAAVIPVALGVAARRGLSGKWFLEAVVLGYEVAIRSALIMRELGGPRKGSGGWTVTGAAAAAAHLFNLDSGSRLNALGLAEYYAPQAPQDRSVAYPSDQKEGLAWGAYSGYTTACLAADGLAAMHPFLATSPHGRDLGQNFEIQRVYFKRHACCRFAHPAIDAAIGMMIETGRSVAEIHTIHIETFEKATLMSRCRPRSVMEALYSVPFALACAIIHGGVEPRHLTTAGLVDADVLALASKIHLTADAALTSAFPEKCGQRLKVTFTDGTTYASGVSHAKGDPDNPYTEAELIAKFQSLAQPVVGAKWEAIVAAVFDLEQQPCQELAKLLAC